MNVPTDIWILIAGDDARLWNLIVRAIPGLHTTKLVNEMKTKFGYTLSEEDKLGTICGLRHTGVACHQYAMGRRGNVSIMMNYGRLCNYGDQCAYSFDDQVYQKIKIYATSGVITRQGAPAIAAWFINRQCAIDIYMVNGRITKIHMFSSGYQYTEIIVEPVPDSITSGFTCVFIEYSGTNADYNSLTVIDEFISQLIQAGLIKQCRKRVLASDWPAIIKKLEEISLHVTSAPLYMYHVLHMMITHNWH